ncbi:MAG: hypothetical protein H7Y09_05270 [Chitinophagaceae bacterium]|nr:hypothetical protein [Anaerolineae bacterium]
MPSLYGYVATTPRAAAQVILRGSEPYRDPILAAWQYGLGRSVAFTSDATARWGTDWLNWEDYSRFWSQAIRWTMTEGANSNLETRVVMEDEQARIIVDARDEEGAFLNGLNLETRVVFDPEQDAQRIELRQVAPGRYEGVFSPDEEGAYFLRTTDPSREGISQTTGWVMTYSPEYEVRQVDDTLLAAIAQLTGGENLAATPEGIFEHNLNVISASVPLWPWLLLAAMLLLPFDIAVRRLIVTQSDLRRLRAYMSARFVPRQLATEGPARISALREARERARDNIRTATPIPTLTPDDAAPSIKPTTSEQIPLATGGISALKERRQQARTEAPTAPSPVPQATPKRDHPLNASDSAPKPTSEEIRQPRTVPPPPSKPVSGENIGARLLKKRRNDDEEPKS